MAIPLQGGKTLIFSVESVTYGYIQNATVDHATDETTGPGPGGDVMSIQQYNDTFSLSFDCLLFATATGVPEIGSIFAYDHTGSESKNYYLTSVSDARTVDGFTSISVTGTSYPHLGTPDV